MGLPEGLQGVLHGGLCEGHNRSCEGHMMILRVSGDTGQSQLASV